ncbi:E3 ubiquitin-protein ligase DTX3L-like [Trichosurus vulpecula]|uniref:E3 ubiquitin-protein ligase DTX3L-like n=1 Tax=Trichosurus vulpecula TaxID=9337 RepID=UPI00186B1051|nr:E3 ubiquitin-protein ligase DTX3L-like [Trichosurus vulpecula]
MAAGGSARGPPYRVLVRASESCSGLEKKLQKYFQSRRKSGGGECTVKAGPTEGTFWVEFLEREAKERVIAKGDHTVEVSATSHVKVFLGTNETSGEKNSLEISWPSSQTQSLPKEFLDEQHPEEGDASGSSDSIIQKIFLLLEAYLNIKFSKEQRKKIINLCPNLKIEGGRNGTEKMTGDYQDIEKFYRFLSEKILENDQKDFPHSNSAREIEKIMPNDWNSPILHSNPKHTTEELDFISVPSHLYEYFKYFFAETLDRIEKEHTVHIKITLAYPVDNVCLDFETSKSKDRKAAQEAFTRAFQREIRNVTSQEVHFADNQLALEVQKSLADRFKNLHMRAEEKVLILLGNPQDILEAKHFIEANFSHKQPVKIMVSKNTINNGIEVDTSHLHLLHQEIIEIEKKYDTATEMVNKPQTGKTILLFTPKDKDSEREEKKEEKEECVICMENIRDKVVLSKCKHVFCGPCIREAMQHKPVCPLCQTYYCFGKGSQPDGKMTCCYWTDSLPGYSSCGTIEIHYDMSGGIQMECHPNPGKCYEGTSQVAYLPNNKEGRRVLSLLQRAFHQKLIFTIGQPQTSGTTDVITWNDIHHKTQPFGGPENCGYPDPSYLERVKMELKAKGIE